MTSTRNWEAGAYLYEHSMPHIDIESEAGDDHGSFMRLMRGRNFNLDDTPEELVLPPQAGYRFRRPTVQHQSWKHSKSIFKRDNMVDGQETVTSELLDVLRGCTL